MEDANKRRKLLLDVIDSGFEQTLNEIDQIKHKSS